MTVVSVKIDSSSALRMLTELASNQVPFATALALTKTAQAAKSDLVGGMKSAFSEPTMYTLRSLTVTRAEKTNLVATIGVRGADTGRGAIRWLSPEVFGGVRPYALEALLQPLGLPPSGMYAMPGSAAKKSKGGKIDINWLRSLISDIAEQGVTQARGIVSQSNSRRRKGQGALGYVVLLKRWGKLLPGIYGRRTNKLFPFIVFVGRPQYRAKFDFYGIGQRSIEAHFPVEFDAAISRAIATAR